MNKNLIEFRLFDIDVKVHWSFVLVLAFGAIVYGVGPAGWLVGSLYGVLTFLLLFVCVTLHELGHALTARHFGIGTRSILLLPIGGVANLERNPDKPLQEFLIVLAGPLVNVVLAVLLFVPAIMMAGVSSPDVLGLGVLRANIQSPGLATLLGYLVVMNVTLALFNLLPAFPMDGGRLLRALLAMHMSMPQATRIAVFVGRIMAILLAVFGIFSGGILLLLIAFFVYVGGSAELEAVTSRAVLKHVRAGTALTPDAAKLYATERVGRVVDMVMNSYQTDFPVVDLSGNFVGVLTPGRLVYALREIGDDARVADVMVPAREIPTCSAQMDLANVWEQMAQHGSRIMAVYDGDRFLGVLTTDDVTEVFQVMGAALEGRERRQAAKTAVQQDGNKGHA